MFEVTIDLSQHFTNYRKKCIVMIRNEWSTIRDLQTYLKQIFTLKKIEFTTTDHVWIPASEPIDILKLEKFDELIGVGIKSKILQTKTKDIDNNNRNTKKTVTNFIEKISTEEIINDTSKNIINVLKSSRKRKILNKSNEKSTDDNTKNLELLTTVSTTSISPSPKKKRKRHKKAQIPKETLDDKQENVSEKSTTIIPAKELSENHLRFDEFGNTVIETTERKINFKNFLDTLNPTRSRIISTIVQNNQPQEENISEKNINDLKHNNENNHNNQNDVNNDENADNNDAFDYNVENTDNKDENCANNQENNDDNKENNNDDNNIENNEEKISNNHVIIKENKIINNGFELLKKAFCPPQPEKIVPPIQIDKIPEDICEVKIIIDSDSDIDDDVQFIKTTTNYEEYLNTIFALENANAKEKRILPISHILEDQPKVKDTLIFKINVNRHNEKSESCLSDYICGKLENITEKDNEKHLEICIIAGAAELNHPQGKVIPGYDDKSDYLKIKFDELRETRILNHNMKD